MKTLIVGLGNEILTDDAVGLYVVRELKKRGNDINVTIVEASLAGLGLVDMLVGYEKIIVVDAIQTKSGQAGQIHRLNSDDLSSTRHTASTHNVNFASALELGRTLGLAIPKNIVIFAIEAEDFHTFREECTPSVRKAIPRCAKMIVREISNKQ